MTAEICFLTILTRNLSDFEEARDLFENDGEMAGMAALDRLCDRYELYDDLEELAELYVRGEFDPLD